MEHTTPAPALRSFGQESQLPMRRVAALCRPQGPLPAIDAVVFAARVVSGPRPAGAGRGAPAGTPGLDQGPDRPGVAGPSARRRLAGPGGGGRFGLRRVGAVSPGTGGA